MTNLWSQADSLKDIRFNLLSSVGTARVSGLYEWSAEFLVVNTLEAFDDDAETEFMRGRVGISPFGAHQEPGGQTGEYPRVWGIVRELTSDTVTDQQVRRVFRTVIVPRLWSATLTTQFRIFQHKSVVDLAKVIFGELGFQEKTDYELRLKTTYEERDYIVQYEESNFAFLSRLLESEGIFYFFEQTDDREKVILADHNGAGPHLGRIQTVTDAATAENAITAGIIVSLGVTRRRVPRTLTMTDYNWREPAVELTAPAEVYGDGDGVVNITQEHYLDLDHGKRLAKIRSEEIRVPETTFRGETFRIPLAPGQCFMVADYFDPKFNTSYFVTEVHHSQSESVATTFTAIPEKTPFRPARVSPKPYVGGVIYAEIDGEFDSIAAPIDAHSCYRVRLKLEQSESPSGQGSRWIRMAQSHSGQGYGIHFPLRKGTEVLIAHVNGDPDRPVILAAIPNAETPSPINSANATQAIIQSASGVQIKFEDNA